MTQCQTCAFWGFMYPTKGLGLCYARPMIQKMRPLKKPDDSCDRYELRGDGEGPIMTHELVNRLSQATGPDRSLDNDIWALLDQPLPDDPAGWPPRYTESIEAALALVPDGWQWQASNRAPKPKAGRAYIYNGEPHSVGVGGMRNNPKYRGHEVTAATPAIAMCIVGLMAREAR